MDEWDIELRELGGSKTSQEDPVKPIFIMIIDVPFPIVNIFFISLVFIILFTE